MFCYLKLYQDPTFTAIASCREEGPGDDREAINGAVSKLAAFAEWHGLEGNVWAQYVAFLMASDENAFSRAAERNADVSGSVVELARHDLRALRQIIRYDLTRIEGAGFLADYRPNALDENDREVWTRPVAELAKGLSAAEDESGMLSALKAFYAAHGCGAFALYDAFRWECGTGAIPIPLTECTVLDDLIGYEEQKKELVENTLAFLRGGRANNVLLYGDGGTGKSSSIKALLHEYASQGLRMIELHKEQIHDLPLIHELIRQRPYRFILFMDDLSFEEFEVEYKYLKAAIEGGLGKRPTNALIYATSNRRHLMKESWKDREYSADDVHWRDTIQEKLSLVDRFGILIRYYSPDKEEYLEMVRRLARRARIEMSDALLEEQAVRWELTHGGFTGRNAQQFVDYLVGQASIAFDQ